MTESPSATRIPASDGFALAGSVYPAGSDVLVISAAVAVPRGFYDPVARFLQTAGFTVVTFDYRGVAESLPEGTGLRDFEASVTDWALLDQRGVLEWVRRELSPLRVWLLGHSLGGQIAGLNSDLGPVAAMATVCSQSGYWRLQGGREPWKVRFYVTVAFPVLCRLFGYLPWSRFGNGTDLPRAAALQWARWCRHPDYLFGDSSLPLERYDRFGAPVLSYSIDDDDWGTARAVDALMAHYPNVDRRHLVPAELGFDRLGHFGYFRPGREALWESLLEWFRRHSNPGLSPIGSA